MVAFGIGACRTVADGTIAFNVAIAIARFARFAVANVARVWVKLHCWLLLYNLLSLVESVYTLSLCRIPIRDSLPFPQEPSGRLLVA